MASLRYCALALAGCMESGTQVAEDNSIGVVAIETDHFEDGSGRTFEIRGVDRYGHDIAHYTVRAGTIDVPGGPANVVGTEIVTRVGDTETRRLTRERQLVLLAPETDPVLKAFVALPSVKSALRDQAHVGYFAAPETPVTEIPFATQTCPASFMNTSPIAGQCCFSQSPFSYHYGLEPYGGGWTLHINGATSSGNSTTGSQRNRNPGVFDGDNFTQAIGTPCRAYGGDSCSGSSCYYGPNGFARAILSQTWTWASSTTTMNQGWAYCVMDNNWRDFPGIYGDVTGTFATGQGCPGGDDGAGEWDY